MGYQKNLSFHNDFKNIHMTLVKSAPKKSAAQKTGFLGLGKIFLLLKLVVCALFTKVIFDTLFYLFKEKKVFIS